MKRFLLTLVLLAVPQLVSAQVANPSAVDFVSTDQNAVIPVGQVGAGQPLLASYQGMLFAVAADPSTGTPLVVGPVIAKTLAVVQPAANTYRLTFAQLGVTIPACANLPCPQFSLVLVSIGPGGISARGVSAESDPFTATVPTQPRAPAGPTTVKVVP